MRRGARSSSVLALAAALVLDLQLPARAAPFAWITNQGSHDVSVVDLAQGTVVGRVAVGRSPAGVVASDAAGLAFVSNPDSRSISVIDLDSATVRATLPGGDGPVGIDVSADGRELYVADWYRNVLRVTDMKALDGAAATREIAIGRAPAGVAADPRGRLVWVAERDDDSVAVVDAQAGRVVGRVRVGHHPFAVLVDAPRQRLVALNVLSDDVTVVDIADPAQPRAIATIPVGKAPYGAALVDGGRFLWITNQHDDSVSVIDAQTLKEVRRVGGYGYPEGIAATRSAGTLSSTSTVVIVNWMDDEISIVSAPSASASGASSPSNGAERRVAVGRNPRGFGVFISQRGPHSSMPAPPSAAPAATAAPAASSP